MYGYYSYIKQNVTSDQIMKLQIRQLAILVDFIDDLEIDFTQYKRDNIAKIAMKCTIGKLIEILSQDKSMLTQIEPVSETKWNVRLIPVSEPLKKIEFESIELCDALWEAVKNQLKK